MNYFISFIALFVAHTIFGQANQVSSAEIDSLVQKALQKFQGVGVAIAVVKDGEIIHEKGYGVQSINTKEPVNEYTNFQIASTTKAFTAAALAMLVDEGKLSWKDKVRIHIPEFTMNNEYVTEHFTVADLLCHRSGLASNAGDLMLFPDGADFTVDDVLKNLRFLEPVSEFRTQFDYNNLMYIVTGEVVARVSGRTWDEFVQTRILDELEMNHSFATLNRALMDNHNLAKPHSIRSGKPTEIPYYNGAIAGPAGDIVSNVHDMATWMNLQLNQGKFGANSEKELFSDDRQLEMWSIHTNIEGNPFPPNFNSHFGGYGLGWNLADINGNLMVAHSGGINGMSAEIVMIPDQQLGIIIFTNIDGGAGMGITRAIEGTLLEKYLGLETMDWVELMGMMVQFQAEAESENDQVWETVAKNRKTKLNEQAYIGIYEDQWFGKVEVSLKADQLWFKSHRSPKFNGALKFYQGNTFAIKWEEGSDLPDAFILFNLDENGMGKSIQLKEFSAFGGATFRDLNFERVPSNN
jgi:CubicO group peptidase (beta-lactamase class C family)